MEFLFLIGMIVGAAFFILAAVGDIFL